MKFRHTAIAACLLAAPYAMAQTGTTMPPGHPTTMGAGPHSGGMMTGDNPARGSMAGHDSATIRNVQRELTKAGYDAGPADGRMGAKTRSALADYQRSKGITAKGLDGPTLTALGVSASSGGSSPGTARAPGEGTLGSSPNQQPGGGAPVNRADRSMGAGSPPAGGTSKGNASSPGEGTMGASPAANPPAATRSPADAGRAGSSSNPQTPAGPAGGSK